MRTPILALAVALSACFVSGDTSGDASIVIDNQSDYVIEEVHVAPVDSRSWGPNLVPDALFPGEAVEIIVDCDVYDVLIVDELGVECVLASIDLCFSSDVWVITNGTLDACFFQ